MQRATASGDLADYPRSSARFPGSFGSAYPRAILFHQERSRRVLTEKVDFISAPGSSPPEVYRPGGPYALVMPLCVFRFDRPVGRFSLASAHSAVSGEAIREATGFAYEEPAEVRATPPPDAATLALLRGDIARTVAETCPAFAAATWGVAHS